MSKSKVETEEVLEITKDEIIEVFDKDKFKDDFRKEMLQEFGVNYLKNLNVKEDVAVSKPINELPRKIIYEIKGCDDENAMLNGAYLPGKIVGKYEFKLVQQISNRNSSFERENDYYVTGLEPEFYENDSRLSQEALNIRLKDIRIAKQFLENKYKKSLDPKNYKFWSNIRFTLDDIGLVYSTNKQSTNQDSDHLLLYYVILAGGCQDIAASYEEAKEWNKMYYLTVKQDESVRKFAGTKQKLEAASKLNDIYQNWKKEDILYLLYALNLKTNHGYHLDTPIEMIVEEFEDFIKGKNFIQDITKKPGEFLEIVKTFEQEPDVVKVKGLFLAADYFGFISYDPKAKEYKNRQTGTIYGSTLEVSIAKLLNPKYIEDLSDLKKRVFNKWKN